MRLFSQIQKRQNNPQKQEKSEQAKMTSSYFSPFLPKFRLTNKPKTEPTKITEIKTIIEGNSGM